MNRHTPSERQVCHNPPRLGRRRRGRRTSAPVRRPPEPGSHRYRSWINERSTLNLLYQRSTLNGRSRHGEGQLRRLCICALAFAGRSLHTLTTYTRSARNTGSASGYGGWGAYPLPRGDANRSGFRQARIARTEAIPRPADRQRTGHTRPGTRPARPAISYLRDRRKRSNELHADPAGLGAGGHRSIHDTGAQ